jgi:hypothetical protein
MGVDDGLKRGGRGGIEVFIHRRITEIILLNRAQTQNKVCKLFVNWRFSVQRDLAYLIEKIGG